MKMKVLVAALTSGLLAFSMAHAAPSMDMIADDSSMQSTTPSTDNVGGMQNNSSGTDATSSDMQNNSSSSDPTNSGSGSSTTNEGNSNDDMNADTATGDDY